MTINKTHMFLSKINGKNISFDKIDYTIHGLVPRLQFVTQLLNKNEEFLKNYFDDYYCSTPSKEDYLSHRNNICNKLESLGTYLLSQVPEKAKLEYRFYNGQKNFENVLRKEYSLDKIIEDASQCVQNHTDGDIMYFLHNDDNVWYLPKTIKITCEDLERKDELGELLRQYSRFHKMLVDKKKYEQTYDLTTKKSAQWNTTKLKYMIGSVQTDMIDLKVQTLKPITFINCLKGSSKSYWDDVDFLNPIHVECFLKLDCSDTNFDDDLSLLLNYFNKKKKKIIPELSYKEKQVLKILRWGIRSVDKINDALQVGYNRSQIKELFVIDAKELNFIISNIVLKFINKYEQDVQTYLDYRRDNSTLINLIPTKTCTCCKKTKPLSSFTKKKDMKDGHRNQCRRCVKEGIKK